MEYLIPKKVYYEPAILDFELGQKLYEKYKERNVEMHSIESHNNIPELRQLPDKEFIRMKKYLILGIRKTLRLVPNNRSADFIVPFTSSGCSAMCLYCYLVCTFFKNSYLRIFVNREQMIDKIRKMAEKTDDKKIYEIGCNSDMVLENTLTGNLKWAIEQFARIPNARSTFATKFSQIDDLLDIDHNGHTQIRISVNPEDIIKKIEIGTSPLSSRIEAGNKMHRVGYRVGINIAPIILEEGWKDKYIELLDQLKDNLDDNLKKQVFFELIYMTYGLANEKINKEAIPNSPNMLNRSIMKPKGRGKYCYNYNIRKDASDFLKKEIEVRFPKGIISYIV